MREILKKIYWNIKLFLYSIISSTGFLSAFYYLFFNKSFWLENKSVLKGKLFFYLKSRKKKYNSYFLRRQIHRIEKGIIQKKRNKIFALKYIIPTVECLKMATEIKGICELEIQWAYDVLTHYFTIVDDHVNIVKARNIFNTINILSKTDKIPYKFKQQKIIEYEQLLKLCKQKKSIRYYEDKNIENSDIDDAVVLASLAPSACNRQPFRYLIINDKEIIKQFSNIMPGINYDNYIPYLAVLIGNLSAYSKEIDRHLIFIDASLSAMLFMLALQTKGIASCPINCQARYKREKKIMNILNLKINEKVIMLITFGYPDPNQHVAFSQRKSLEELRQYL